jgi:nitroreductase
MPNAVFDTVRTVMAIRDFQDKSVPDDVIKRIVESGRLTGSGSNQQPWHFVVVRERDRLRELGSLVRTGPYTAKAAFAIIVGYEKANRLGLSDASRAIQSMILSAWAEGVGSNWTGFAGMEEVRKRFGFPEGYDVVGVLPFGYPARSLKGIKKRKPLGQVASVERHGAPFS